MFSIGRILYALGLLLMLLCILDVGAVYYFKIELTGYQHTPMILGGIGIILLNVSRFFARSPSEEEEEE